MINNLNEFVHRQEKGERIVQEFSKEVDQEFAAQIHKNERQLRFSNAASYLLFTIGWGLGLVGKV